MGVYEDLTPPRCQQRLTHVVARDKLRSVMQGLTIRGVDTKALLNDDELQAGLGGLGSYIADMSRTGYRRNLAPDFLQKFQPPHQSPLAGMVLAPHIVSGSQHYVDTTGDGLLYNPMSPNASISDVGVFFAGTVHKDPTSTAVSGTARRPRKLVLLSGVSGCGKSMFAQRQLTNLLPPPSATAQGATGNDDAAWVTVHAQASDNDVGREYIPKSFRSAASKVSDVPDNTVKGHAFSCPPGDYLVQLFTDALSPWLVMNATNSSSSAVEEAKLLKEWGQNRLSGVRPKEALTGRLALHLIVDEAGYAPMLPRCVATYSTEVFARFCGDGGPFDDIAITFVGTSLDAHYLKKAEGGQESARRQEMQSSGTHQRNFFHITLRQWRDKSATHYLQKRGLSNLFWVLDSQVSPLLAAVATNPRCLWLTANFLEGVRQPPASSRPRYDGNASTGADYLLMQWRMSKVPDVLLHVASEYAQLNGLKERLPDQLSKLRAVQRAARLTLCGPRGQRCIGRIVPAQLAQTRAGAAGLGQVSAADIMRERFGVVLDKNDAMVLSLQGLAHASLNQHTGDYEYTIPDALLVVVLSVFGERAVPMSAAASHRWSGLEWMTALFIDLMLLALPSAADAKSVTMPPPVREIPFPVPATATNSRLQQENKSRYAVDFRLPLFVCEPAAGSSSAQLIDTCCVINGPRSPGPDVIGWAKKLALIAAQSKQRTGQTAKDQRCLSWPR